EIHWLQCALTKLYSLYAAQRISAHELQSLRAKGSGSGSDNAGRNNVETGGVQNEKVNAIRNSVAEGILAIDVQRRQNLHQQRIRWQGSAGNRLNGSQGRIRAVGVSGQIRGSASGGFRHEQERSVRGISKRSGRTRKSDRPLQRLHRGIDIHRPGGRSPDDVS